MCLWHEDDSFWEVVDPFMFPAERWATTPDEVTHIIALTSIHPKAAILDLCCGPGRHSLEFARRGYQVIGVDRTAYHLDKARNVAKAEGLGIQFVQADARHFRRPEHFDLAVNLYTSFGYFSDPEEDRQLLVNVYESLRPGGKLVMELMGKEILARIFQPRGWSEAEGMFKLEDRKIRQDWDWIENRWIIIHKGQQFEYDVSHRLYSATELKHLLHQAGFFRMEVYGSLGGDLPYDHQAQRLVVMAAKPC